MARTVTHLEGEYEELSSEDAPANEIARATRVDHDDGGIDIVVLETERDHPWEARLEAAPGSQRFAGRMTSPDWEDHYDLAAELWLSPDGEELLLLGWCTSADEEAVAFKMVLWERDEDDG